MRIIYTIAVFVFFLIQSINGQILFKEASGLGLNNVTYGDGILGGGISFFDFDQDGWDDITVSSEINKPVRFFKNFQGSFVEVFFNIVDPLYQTKTVQWVDFDNDADYDFFVTGNTDSNRLYENDGTMSFTDITVAAGLMTTDNKTFGSSWGDYNNDGLLDLFINSRNPSNNNIPNILYHNNGDGTFTNVNDDAGISPFNHLSFCSAFFDYNNDGWQDIVISNDKDPKNLLYHNNGDGTYTEMGEETQTNVIMDAMSTAIGDPNKDGWQDFYVTNTQEGNAFFENNGNGTFSNIATSNGTLMESIAWGAVFLDADNDRDLDLYVSGVLDGTSGMLPSAFYENDGNGNYTIPVGAGFEDDTAQSYANAIGDFNNDGFPDIIVLNYAPDDIFLWQNSCPVDYNWLKVKLQGTESNRMGIGSTIEIMVGGEKQYNYTLCGEGYLGQNSAYEFFGIGDATEIEYVKVTWLSGIVDFIENPGINQVMTIIEGSTLGTTDHTGFDFGIAPNPTTGHINIQLPTYINNPPTLIISDVQGRKLKVLKLNTGKSLLNVSTYEKGLYFFHLEYQGNIVSKKVLIE